MPSFIDDRRAEFLELRQVDVGLLRFAKQSLLECLGNDTVAGVVNVTAIDRVLQAILRTSC